MQKWQMSISAWGWVSQAGAFHWVLFDLFEQQQLGTPGVNGPWHFCTSGGWELFISRGNLLSYGCLMWTFSMAMTHYVTCMFSPGFYYEGYLRPCHSKYGLRTSSNTYEQTGNVESLRAPSLLNPNLHFNKIHKEFSCTFKFERH
jgi:hypothetical protein